jgi:hypothetical protein
MGMAESDANPTDPQQVANVTFAYLRRIEDKLGKVMDVLERHDTRLGRLERDVSEVKSDIVLLENKMLSQTNQILSVVERIDEHQQRFDAIAPSA